MLYREIEEKIKDFFQTEKKSALMITGARQVGKTYCIREFAKENFPYVIEINFLEMPSAVTLFENASDSRDILLRISALTDVPMEKGKTLIFFDEVQECKEIVTAIKFLVEEGSFRYILSGSLLGVVCAGQRFSYRSGAGERGADGLYQHERGEAGATGRILGCEHAFVGALRQLVRRPSARRSGDIAALQCAGDRRHRHAGGELAGAHGHGLGGQRRAGLRVGHPRGREPRPSDRPHREGVLLPVGFGAHVLAGA